MPEGAVYVGRPSRWGNPFVVRPGGDLGWQVLDSQMVAPAVYGEYAFEGEAMAGAVSLFEHHLGSREQWGADELELLRGRDLACWCPLDQACHADVLLRVANPPPREPARPVTGPMEMAYPTTNGEPR